MNVTKDTQKINLEEVKKYHLKYKNLSSGCDVNKWMLKSQEAVETVGDGKF